MDSIQYQIILRRVATLLAVSIITLAAIAAVTGILLSYYYHPAAGEAYKSLAQIATVVNSGYLVLGMHQLAGNGIIVVALLQIVVLFLGRQFSRSWLTAWISGILLTLNAIGLGWTAMILGWDQEGFWRLKVELGTVQAIPFIGGQLREILTGGAGVNTTTVLHLYTLHSYVLSLSAIAISAIHLGGLVFQEIEQKQLIRKQIEKLSTPVTESESLVKN